MLEFLESTIASTVKRDTQKERTTKSRNSWGIQGFLVNSETSDTGGANNQISEKVQELKR